MSMSLGLGNTLSTSQKLTPQMQQAIKLLQLSSVELEQEVQMKLDSNPLLERVEDDDIKADDFDSVEELTRLESMDDNESDDYAGDINDPMLSDYSGREDDAIFDTMQNKEEASQYEYASQLINDNPSSSNDDSQEANDSSERITDDKINDLEVDTNWEEVYTHAPTAMASPDTRDIDDYHGATSANLQDHVRWQLNFKHLTEAEVLIADYLIDAMDDSGFIQMNLDELTQSFDVMSSFYQWNQTISREQIDNVIKIIQSCEPIGVGARNLAECLQIQLEQLPEHTPYLDQAIRLLDSHEYLVSNNIKALVAQTGVKKEDISECLDLIRTLNPSPGLTFKTAQPSYHLAPESYDIPDVLVKQVHKDDSAQLMWEVKLNPDTLPKLRVNKEYANLVKRGDNSPENVYLRDNLSDARLFIRSIEERNHNLLKVATCIVERQHEFLIEGPTAMKPMILKDVADTVGLHESTVSRLTTSKSILTPQGLFSLKHFFSSYVSSSDGDISSTAICAMIREIIEGENPKKPFSDSAIQKHLQGEGIDIARRTVAKYREVIGIGSSTQRKVKF